MFPADPIPNVLFICADDLNSWIGPLERYRGVKTPHIDALASRGTLFTHAYCTAPHCNPSRASVFSGQRPSTSGVYREETLPHRAGIVPLPEQFLRAGYEVFGAGKVLHGQYDYQTATSELAASARWADSHNDLSLWSEFHPLEAEPLPKDRPLNRLFDFRDGEEVSHWYSHFDWGPLPDASAKPLPDLEVAERVIEFYSL